MTRSSKDHGEALSASDVCRALADPARLRIFVRLAHEGELATSMVAATREDLRNVAKLISAGLLLRDGDQLTADVEIFAKAAAASVPPRSPGGMDPSSTDVDALFFNGRIVSMPRNRALKSKLLAFVAQRFEVGSTYVEAEVNEILSVLIDDHVALRRYLIDGRFLDRDNYGSYWRRPRTPG